MKVAVLAALLFLAAPSDEINLTGASVNVAEPGTPVKIRILRWSTDQERAPLLAVLNPAPPQPPGAQTQTEPARGRAGAAAGRGRGRGRGGAATPLSPIAAFTAALGRAPTIGFIWTSDVTGYSIKYAWRSALPDGTERIVLASDRRLGAYSDAWKATTQGPETDYTFTVLELRVEPKGLIEGKTSLTNRIVVDAEAKTIALENYAAATSVIERRAR
jgi:hypothetical protein